MAVTAECPFCGHRSTAPADFRAGDVQCPRCENVFTIIPRDAPTRRGAVPGEWPRDRRLRRRGHVILLRCPCCSTLVELSRRKLIALAEPETIAVAAASTIEAPAPVASPPTPPPSVQVAAAPPVAMPVPLPTKAT